MRPFGSALVTGAAGFIGHALTRKLSSEGIRTFCLVLEGRYNPAAFASLPGTTVVEVPSAPVGSLARVLSGIHAEVIFNLASYGVNPDEQDPEIMFDANLHFLSRLMLITSSWKCRRFIHIGSCFEYGEPIARKPMPEEHPLRPFSLYGAAKAASVIYGTALAARLGIPFVTLRLFGVYGPGERPHRLIPYIIQRLSSDSTVDLTPGEQVRDLLYVDDVVDALLHAASSDSVETSHVYNVCSGVPLTIRQVGEEVAKVMGKGVSLLHWGERPYRASEAMWLVGENKRFRETTGWTQKTSLEDGIKRMVLDLQENQYAKGRAL